MRVHPRFWCLLLDRLRLEDGHTRCQGPACGQRQELAGSGCTRTSAGRHSHGGIASGLATPTLSGFVQPRAFAREHRCLRAIARAQPAGDHRLGPCGWDDPTGERTVPLMRALLAKHANLSMSIKLGGAHLAVRSRWTWRAQPPERICGSLRNRQRPVLRRGVRPVSAAQRFVNVLPIEVATTVARDNARRSTPC